MSFLSIPGEHCHGEGGGERRGVVEWHGDELVTPHQLKGIWRGRGNLVRIWSLARAHLKEVAYVEQ